MKSCLHRIDSRPRRGTSIIEVIIVVTISVFLLGLAVTTIHLLLRAERHTTQNAWYATSLARFSRVFRQDVHAATAAELQTDADGKTTGVLLKVDGGRSVSFTGDRDSVVRTVSEGDAVQHRDEFFLPRGSTLQFDHADALVHAVIHRPAQSSPKINTAGVTTPPGRTVRIEAGLARDHRFAAKEAP